MKWVHGKARTKQAGDDGTGNQFSCLAIAIHIIIAVSIGSDGCIRLLMIDNRTIVIMVRPLSRAPDSVGAWMANRIFRVWGQSWNLESATVHDLTLSVRLIQSRFPRCSSYRNIRTVILMISFKSSIIMYIIIMLCAILPYSIMFVLISSVWIRFVAARVMSLASLPVTENVQFGQLSQKCYTV